MAKFRFANYNTFQDMSYFLCFLVKSRQTDDRQTDRQNVMHMSPPCKLHRWAQKVKGTSPIRGSLVMIVEVQGEQNEKKTGVQLLENLWGNMYNWTATRVPSGQRPEGLKSAIVPVLI